VDGQWERGERPLDVPHSRLPQNYDTPLPPATKDWERANEIEHHAPRQPVPDLRPKFSGGCSEQQQQQSPYVVVNSQHRAGMVAAANRASSAWKQHLRRMQQQQQREREQHLLDTAAQTPLPIRSVSVVKEVVVATQPAPMEPQRSAPVVGTQQPSITADTQRPSTVVEVTPAPEVTHTVTGDRALVVGLSAPAS
jgi:ABC-type ATPase with predicted acetyltransferase domain